MHCIVTLAMHASGCACCANLPCMPICFACCLPQGVRGLFQGIVPRVLLGVWQTLFMVTGAKLVQDALADMGSPK